MIYAVVCDPGPGDTLRFIQGLCEMTEEKNEKVMLFCLKEGFCKINTLLQHMKPFNQGDRIEIRIATNLSDLNHLMKRNVSGSVYYCFETKYFKPDSKILVDSITEGLSVEFILLDRFEEQYYIRNKILDHLILDRNMKNVNRKILLFVRICSIVPERNMSLEMFNNILKLCQNKGLCTVIAGSFLPESYRNIMKLYPDASVLYSTEKYPDYYQQICDYSQFAFAIGMNSGGLDLAAASGIPILRIGEFHQCLTYGSVHYNDFLSGARTVNILSNSEKDISNISIELLHIALQKLYEGGRGEIIYVK